METAGRSAVVFAAGELPAIGHDIVRTIVAQTDMVIAADGGLRHLISLGVTPRFIVGDLDSAAPDQVQAAQAAGAELVTAPEAKDETDLELAIEVARSKGAANVVVVGALGGRIDHELANLGLMTASRWHEAGLTVEANDGVRRALVVHDRIELTESAGTIISVLPWGGDASGVRERGMQWDLDDAHLPAGTPRGMSNVAVGPTQEISVASGVLLVIVDRSES